MKTHNSIVATITVITVMIMALLTSFTASANNYESRIKEALELITQKANNCSSIGVTYNAHNDPETGQNDGELHIVKFKLGPREAHLIEQAKAIYQLISSDSQSGKIPYLYTLWLNTANQDRTYSGINLYYSHENSILVGADADNCYTVGFFLSENTDYRNTYTLEWSEANGDSVKGRVITTFGPVASKVHSIAINSGNWPLYDFDIDTVAFNAQMVTLKAGMERLNEGMERLKTSSSSIVITTSSETNNASNWMKQMLFYLDKIQRDGKNSRYIYLSKLYELCKNTDCLDRQDLKIAMQQVASCYKKLKSKNTLQDNELLFLENMADVLEAKIQSSCPQ